MWNYADSSIGRVARVSGARPVQPVRGGPPVGDAARPGGQLNLEIGATTGGSLRPAYAQFVVDPKSQDLVLQVKDGSTNQLINQYASNEVDSMAAAMQQYVATLSLRHAARQASGAQA